MITTARLEDVPQIVSLGYASFHENIIEDYSCKPDFNKVLITLTELVMSGYVLVVRNEDNPNTVEGVLAFKRDSLWWTNDEVLYEALLYVKPEVRTFKLFKNLLNEAKEYAIMNKIPLVFDLFTQKDVNKKRKLLTYLGFKECGSFFVFDPP